MSTNTSRLNEAFERFLPLIIVIAILLFAFFWFLQPKLAAYVSSRGDVTSLTARVETLQATIRQGQGEPPADATAVLRDFDARVSPDDKVADVLEFLVRSATASAPKDRFRALEIQTGEVVRGRQNSGRMPRVSGRTANDPDPRFGLFPVTLTHTPVTIVFESSFEGIAEFVWRLRDLPTTAEIRSLELTRGLPLMKAELTVFVVQRGAPAIGEPAPDEVDAPPAGVPRVAMLDPGDEGR